MAGYNSRDPSTTQMLLKRRKLSTPSLFTDPPDDTDTDATTQLLNSAAVKASYNSGDVTPSDVFPGSALSPVRVEGVGGAYGSIPVVSGGQVLYPVGLEHKRIAMKNEQDALEQEREAKVKNLFGMQLSAPAMAPALQKFYFDEVQKRMNDVYATLGHEKATAALSDLTNPITQNVLKPYADYSEAVKASYNVQDAMGKVADEVNTGKRVMSSATKQEIADIQNGTWLNKKNSDGSDRTIKDYAKIPTRFQTYAPLDEKIKALKDAGAFDQDVNEVVQRGVTVDGKPLKSLNGHALLDQIATKAVNSDKIQGIKNALLTDPDLTDVTEQMVNDRLFPAVKSVTHTITGYANLSSGGMTEYDKKKIDYQNLVNKRYEYIKQGISGDDAALKQLSIGQKYKDGTVTNLKIIPAGTEVIKSGTNKKETVKSDYPTALIEYTTQDKYGIAKPHQEQLDLNPNTGHGFEEFNKLMNTNREGTAEFVNPEDIKTLYSSDPDFNNKPVQSGSSATTSFTVDGKTYNIPNNKVVAFKKAKGIN